MRKRRAEGGEVWGKTGRGGGEGRKRRYFFTEFVNEYLQKRKFIESSLLESNKSHNCIIFKNWKKKKKKEKFRVEQGEETLRNELNSFSR